MSDLTEAEKKLLEQAAQAGGQIRSVNWSGMVPSWTKIIIVLIAAAACLGAATLLIVKINEGRVQQYNMGYKAGGDKAELEGQQRMAAEKQKLLDAQADKDKLREEIDAGNLKALSESRGKIRSLRSRLNAKSSNPGSCGLSADSVRAILGDAALNAEPGVPAR